MARPIQKPFDTPAYFTAPNNYIGRYFRFEDCPVKHTSGSPSIIIFAYAEFMIFTDGISASYEDFTDIFVPGPTSTTDFNVWGSAESLRFGWWAPAGYRDMRGLFTSATHVGGFTGTALDTEVTIDRPTRGDLGYYICNHRGSSIGLMPISYPAEYVHATRYSGGTTYAGEHSINAWKKLADRVQPEDYVIVPDRASGSGQTHWLRDDGTEMRRISSPTTAVGSDFDDFPTTVSTGWKMKTVREDIFCRLHFNLHTYNDPVSGSDTYVGVDLCAENLLPFEDGDDVWLVPYNS